MTLHAFRSRDTRPHSTEDRIGLGIQFLVGKYLHELVYIEATTITPGTLGRQDMICTRALVTVGDRATLAQE